MNESNLIISELFITILNTLQCIKTEEDRWILAEKVSSQQGDKDHIIKRQKIEFESYNSGNSHVTRVALRYSDIRKEFDNILERMKDAIQKQLGF